MLFRSLAVPIILLYEISIFMAKMVEKKKKKRAEAEDDNDADDDTGFDLEKS